jgi:hypothetical protein
MLPRVCALRALLPLLYFTPSVAHTWFPAGWVHGNGSARGLTTSDCASTVSSPQWTSGPASNTTFESYHLHVAWAAGNTAQAAAVTSFKSWLISVANATASCSTLSDTATYFCYSQTINSDTSSSKQDPFYNQDMFIFVGTAFFKSAMSFAMRCVGHTLRSFRRAGVAPLAATRARPLDSLHDNDHSRRPARLIPPQLPHGRSREHIQH